MYLRTSKKTGLGSAAPRRCGRRGFTLVEVLIVAALFSVVSVALFGSFTAGLRVWKAASNPDFSRRKALLGMARFAQDLRHAVFSEYNGIPEAGPIGFFGDPAGCSFFELRGGKIYRVLYMYYDSAGEVGRSAAEIRPGGEVMHPMVPRTVMTRVKDFQLRYGGHNQMMGHEEFLETWNSSASGGSPLAVKISVELESGQTYEQVVNIPGPPY